MTLQQNAILKADGLQFFYPSRRLFDELSFAAPAGITLVLGGDGSGKSTLLRLLAGVTPAAAGTLSINGELLAGDGQAYGRQLFWIAARDESHDQLTVENFFTLQEKQFSGFDRTLLPGLTAGLSLAPHLEKQLFMLSTGSKRKVWLAAALASNAPVVLLDDPFAGLDRASIQFFVERLQALTSSTTQAWIMAMHEAPPGLTLTSTVELDP